MLIPCIVSGFLSDVGVEDIASAQEVSVICPSRETLSEIIKDSGVKVLHNAKDEIAGIESLYIACDKGNKKTDSFFVKIVTWYNPAKGKVVKLVLDVDGANRKSHRK